MELGRAKYERMMEMGETEMMIEAYIWGITKENKDRKHDEFGYDTPWRAVGSQNHVLL